MNNKYLYILGIEPDKATTEVIKNAFRQLSKIVHPDKHAAHPELAKHATDLFRRLREAHDALLENEVVASESSQQSDHSSYHAESSYNSSSNESYQGYQSESGQNDESFEKIRGSDIEGPVLMTDPKGGYYSGGSRFRFLLGNTRLNLSPGQKLPSWETISKFANDLDGPSHISGTVFYYFLIQPNQTFILEYHDTSNDKFGYVVVHRATDGRIWTTSNKKDTKWQTLPIGTRSLVRWKRKFVEFSIEIARPNVDAYKDGREVIYRFNYS